jgi:hypothetical protein
MSSVTFDVAVGGDGSTVTDDNNATTGLREGGWKTRFVPCFTQQVAVANYIVTKAGEAATSATAASSSATAAAASYDSFDDRYLGAKSSDPTLDNDGNALLTGAIYWNSSTSVMKVWSGSAWVSYNPAISYLPLTGGTMTGAITFAAGQFGTNVNTFLSTPSSANLAAALTDKTGTNVNVFNNTPTLITPILGTPTSGTLSSCTVDGTNGVGYKNIPQTGSDKTTAYTLVTGDVGKYVGVGTSGSIVVPTSTFANGDAISIFNNTTGNVTITTSAPTAYICGTNTVKTSITLATRGIATILFVSATVCVVTGNVS